MEKTIEISGQKVKLKSTGGTPMRYKSQFRSDFFADLLKLKDLEKLDDKNIENFTTEEIAAIDFEVFYRFIWAMAKTADHQIDSPLEWLDQFDEFPIVEIIPEVQEMMMANLQQSKKKSVRAGAAAAKS